MNESHQHKSGNKLRARLRSWWPMIKHRRVAIGVAGIALVVLVVIISFIIVGYQFDWTGVNGYNKVTMGHTISGASAGTVVTTEEYQPGKTLWDWLQLLFIPIVLVGVGSWLGRQQSKAQEEATTQWPQGFDPVATGAICVDN